MFFKLNKFFRILFSFLIIYIIWSAFVDLTNLDHKLDDDALAPCLFFLPPLGFFVIGIVLVKVIESAIFLRLTRRIVRWFRNRKKQNPAS